MGDQHLTIQVNASGKGLGAALIQDDGPVTFASKVLRPTEQCHTKMRWNCMPVSLVQNVSGHVFDVFGRHFTNH